MRQLVQNILMGIDMDLMLSGAFAKEMGRRSKILMRLSHSIRRRRAIRSLPELDAFIDDFASRYPTGDIDDGGVQQLLSVYYAEDIKLPHDAFSSAYREAQWELFLRMNAKGRYDLADEGTVIDIEKNRDNFYPFSTASCDTVGKSFIAQGMAIKAMNLKPGSRILEFGPGWGNMSINLAMMGHDVTVVEANQSFIDLIHYRASKHGKSVIAVREDMSAFASRCTERYDAALFVASFHHCQNHTAMLADLARIIKPGGLICFAEEPIMYAENPFLPYQWGLRLDGLSLYFIRKYGWLELGFQYNYLSEALFRAGFTTKRFPSYLNGIADVIVASQTSGA